MPYLVEQHATLKYVNPVLQRVGRRAGILLFALVLGLLLTHRFESAPPPWWDEGWTLTVARNGAEEVGLAVPMLHMPCDPVYPR